MRTRQARKAEVMLIESDKSSRKHTHCDTYSTRFKFGLGSHTCECVCSCASPRLRLGIPSRTQSILSRVESPIHNPELRPFPSLSFRLLQRIARAPASLARPHTPWATAASPTAYSGL
eukprot:1189660-Rhodomonas_salina.1